MARRMSRFIHLAMGAGKEAVATSGIDFAAMTRSSAIASAWSSTPAAAGSRQIIDGTHVHDRRARGSCRPFAIPALSGSMAGCHAVDGVRPDGPVMTQVAACATSVIASTTRCG